LLRSNGPFVQCIVATLRFHHIPLFCRTSPYFSCRQYSILSIYYIVDIENTKLISAICSS
jgi:hypothetical protein